ncbi:hypothetical protein AZE42_10052 [Rhizopogon vesiculosus]|uniref:Uncharacterized protein n=1 Tax=Rhizopogon vesiculosus TaxID=180088 RepID=A0A1J8Q685_9AGAM|nr:hypothetical protein AZE42_10052 [Rhizopogon vesiculosus]
MPCWTVSYSVGISVILTWLKYMQVIMIIRLYAMYQRSRKILVFLVVIFLAIQIACVVLSGIHVRYTSAGELQLWIQNLSGSDSSGEFRGGYHLRHAYVQLLH